MRLGGVFQVSSRLVFSRLQSQPGRARKNVTEFGRNVNTVQREHETRTRMEDLTF